MAKKGGKKKVEREIKLVVPAGQATPQPPVGAALGQAGVNIMEFCKAFNDRTKDMERGVPVSVYITVYSDRSFTFVTKGPVTSYLIKKYAGIEKGSSEPNKNKVGKITKKQLEEIAKVKLPYLNTNELEKAMKIVAGTARSMGVEIVE